MSARPGRATILGLPALVVLIALIAFGLTKCGDDATTSLPALPSFVRTTVARAAVVATTSTVVPTTTTTAPAGTPDLLTALNAAGTFKTLTAAISKAGLAPSLQGAGPLTFFAPTDAAFGKLPEATLARLTSDRTVLARVLRGHVVPQALHLGDLKAGEVMTLAGTPTSISVDATTVRFGSATVQTPEMTVSNGVLQPIDSVLLPADLAPATTIAPASADLVETAIAAGTFTKFTKALQVAGLLAILKTGGPYTVFMPTDAAFAKLPAGVLDALSADKVALAKVLTYHMLVGRLTTADLTPGEHATVAGPTINLTVGGGAVQVNDATVVQSDVAATNGTIQVIDRVLLPADFKLDQLPTAAGPDFTIYFASSSSAIDDAGRAVVAAAVAKIENLPAGSKVTITGVADSQGDPVSNQRLSKARAEAVQAALTNALGANASSVEFILAARGAEAGADLAAARRVEIDLP